MKRLDADCELPDKASDLIALALRDLEAVEKDPRYSVQMWTFHEKMSTKCNVCFAGAVMAKTCDAPIEEVVSPSDFSEENRAKFLALDQFRTGNVQSGLYMMKADTALMRLVPRVIPVTPYVWNGAFFKSRMRELVLILQAAGL